MLNSSCSSGCPQRLAYVAFKGHELDKIKRYMIAYWMNENVGD